MIGERVSWCLCTRGRVIHLCAVHAELVSYWSRRRRCLRERWKRGSDVRWQLITCSLASCLAGEPRIPFSSCDKYNRSTKHIRRSCTLYSAFAYFEKVVDRLPREVVILALRKLGVDEWLICTGIALHTEVCTVIEQMLD